MNVGWQQFDRIYRCIMHIDIKDNKIWIQQNLTDQNPAEVLIGMGVPREDVVLGLQPPYKRVQRLRCRLRNLDRDFMLRFAVTHFDV